MSSLGRPFYTKRFFIFSFINEPVHIPSVVKLFISNPLKFLNTSISSDIWRFCWIFIKQGGRGSLCIAIAWLRDFLF